MRRITSPTNSLLKVFRRALKEGRTRDGWAAVEGALALKEALAAKDLPSRGGLLNPTVTIRSVLLAENATDDIRELLERLRPDAEIAEVPEQVFRSVAQTVSPQGVAALVEVRAPELTAVLKQPDVMLVVSCGLRDPGNLGTIFRSAAAFGGGGVLTLKDSVSPFNPKAMRSSAGALFSLPAYPGLEAGPLFRQLAAAGVRALAADPHSTTVLTAEKLAGPVAFLIGNEAAGLDSEVLHHASSRVRIPIRPGADSLNAAVSASIFLYEAARRRGFRYGGRG